MLPSRADQGFDDAFHIVDNLAVVETLQPPPFGDKESRSASVVCGFGCGAVCCSINFDNQPCLDTGEVSDVRANGNLPTEFPSERFATKTRPKQDFSSGHLLA